MTTAVGPVLWIAAQQGKLSDVRTLLSCEGIDIEVQSGEMALTSLHLASKNGHLMVVLRLIQYGADLKAVDRDGWTALHYACFEEHESILLVLLHNGADVNCADANGVTCLMIAARYGLHKIAAILLFHNADVNVQNSKNETALHFAAARGHESLVRFLLEDGVSTECRSAEGYIAEDLAIANAHCHIASMLKDFKTRRSNHIYRIQRVDPPLEIQTPLSLAPKILLPFFHSIVKRFSFKQNYLKRRKSL
jgi:ankyrin repeat protein